MGKRSRNITYFSIFMLLATQGFSQQDPILTQYMSNMQTINPAYAGMWGETGFSTLVRKQLAGIGQTPLTGIISFHSPLKNDYIGIGLNITNDHFGKENKFSIFSDYSYEIPLTRKARLRFGLKFGFMNYKNPLSQLQLYPDNEFDEAFANDLDLKFLPNFGVGMFLYKKNYYINFSVPRFIKNDLKNNINNYAKQAMTFYVGGGYVLRSGSLGGLIFKPTIMMRAAWDNPLRFDVGANFLLMGRLWLGAMLRTSSTVCATSQLILKNNLRLGFAIDVTCNEVYPYHLGTYEFSLGYGIVSQGRRHRGPKYF